MDPARVGELARLAEVELLAQVLLAVELCDLDSRVGEPARIVRSHDRRHGQALGSLAAAAAALGGCHGSDDKDRAVVRRVYPAPVSTCVVTGGAGFLGSHLCDELLARG